MKQKRGLDKTWIYVIALAVLILLIMIVFRDKTIAFSPDKKTGDDIIESDSTDVKANNFLGMDNLDISSEEQKVTDAFKKIVGTRE